MQYDDQLRDANLGARNIIQAQKPLADGPRRLLFLTSQGNQVGTNSRIHVVEILSR